MPPEAQRLPVRTAPAPGEALDGYLERLATANGIPNPHLVARIAEANNVSFLTLRPDRRFLRRLAAATDLTEHALNATTLQALDGVEVEGLDAGGSSAWRTVAARGWAPQRGTAICPLCLADDGIWRILWRHPWATTCQRHGAWLVSTCPTCGLRFRSHRTPLRSVDSLPGTCGNPAARRGAPCPQPLADTPATRAPDNVLQTGARIESAIHGNETDLLGTPATAADYLAEIKALTVLLLHLAVQPGGDSLAEWAPAARADHDRSAGHSGARWGLAPPADAELRGRAITAADAIVNQPDREAAADALHPWTDLAPRTNDGQLGWLADHTTMTPTLTRIVMAATASRRRLTTLLADQPPIEPRLIPQCLPTDLYRQFIADKLDVTAPTGRLFTSLCLARRGRPGATWAGAAAALGLDPAIGTATARACTGDIFCSIPQLIQALDEVASRLADQAVNYRLRENAVRALAAKRRWHQDWSRRHRPGTPEASRRYAVTLLWAAYADGHLRSSPGWRDPPTAIDLAYYRRYAVRTTPEAHDALVKQIQEPSIRRLVEMRSEIRPD